MNRLSATALVFGLLTSVITLTSIDLIMADEEIEVKVKALVEKGVQMSVAQGEELTLKAIGDPNGPFIDGELYLFAGSLDKIALLAHPYQPNLCGRDLSTFKNSQMFSFIAEFVKIANEDGAGWVEYMWPKPGADEPSLKKTYIMKVPGRNMYIGCGYYPKSEKKEPAASQEEPEAS